MIDVRELHQAFLRTAPWSGRILSFTAVGVVGAIVTAVRAPDRPRYARAIIVPFVCLFAVIATGVLAVEHGRSQMLPRPFGELDLQDAASIAMRLADGLSLQLNALVLTCMAAMILITALVLGRTIAELRRQDQRWTDVAATAALVVPACLAVAAVLQYAAGIAQGFSAIAGADPSNKAMLLEQGLAEVGLALHSGRQLFVGASFVCAIAGLVVVARAPRMSPVTSVAAIGVLLLGLSAFALTRARAYDGAHPLKELGVSVLSATALANLASHPGTGCSQDFGAVLGIQRGQAQLNGVAIRDPLDLAKELENVRSRYRLLHGDDQRLPAVLLSVDRDVPTRELAPWLLALVRSGMPSLKLVVARKQLTETKTLGALDRTRGCTLALELDPSGVPLAQFPDWEHVVASLRGDTLRLAP
jgi:hypothetical protein